MGALISFGVSVRHTFQGFQDLRKRLKEKHGKKLSSVDGQFPSSHKPSLLTNQNSMQVVEERCAKLQTWLNGVSVLGSIGGDKVFLDWLEAPEDAERTQRRRGPLPSAGSRSPRPFVSCHCGPRNRKLSNPHMTTT